MDILQHYGFRENSVIIFGRFFVLQHLGSFLMVWIMARLSMAEAVDKMALCPLSYLFWLLIRQTTFLQRLPLKSGCTPSMEEEI
jgi:hypothetical protein